MKALRWILVALGCTVSWCAAHVGSPTVFYDGAAGPYNVRVTIRPPGVIPGLAEITVEAAGVQSVEVLPVFLAIGKAGSPPPDPALPVRGKPGVYAASLWLMESGAYSVHVTLQGDRGRGEAIVPVDSVANRRLPMPPGLGTLLALLGLGLFAGLCSIVGAAVRESSLPPGVFPDAGRRRLARWTTAFTACFLATALYGGKAWWDAVDRDYRNNRMYKPWPMTAEWSESGKLLLKVDARDWRGRGELIPDHGKWMHLFAMRAPEWDAFAHLHPVPAGTLTFETDWPPELPPGSYRLFADLTEQSGMAHTLVVHLEVPQFSATPAPSQPDPDDAWARVVPVQVTAAKDPVCEVAPELRLVWETPGSPRAGVPLSLAFRVENRAGQPVRLEPYLGMTAHAAVLHEDGTVFTHLHPVGTFSMAAQQLFVEKTGLSASEDYRPHRHLPAGVHRFSFPYEFPKPGTYRVWVQFKVQGTIWTAAYVVPVG